MNIKLPNSDLRNTANVTSTQSAETNTGSAILLPALDFSSGLSCPPSFCPPPPSFCAPALGVVPEPGWPVEDAVSAGRDWPGDEAVGLSTADDGFDAPPSSPPPPPPPLFCLLFLTAVSASQVAASSPKT
ncbi:hypothetical protein MCOR28_000573 [Pyricularia oryzae]|nr:hypothetical protein MCOR28_000573 [Pyricularia oryzae]